MKRSNSFDRGDHFETILVLVDSRLMMNHFGEVLSELALGSSCGRDYDRLLPRIL